MSIDSASTPRSLTASEYVLALFQPTDNVAILVRNRSTRQTVQTIAKAEAVANPEFQRWLSNQSAAGYDVYVGMNPIKDGAYSRTKEQIKISTTSISTSTERATKHSKPFEIHRSPRTELRPRYFAR